MSQELQEGAKQHFAWPFFLQDKRHSPGATLLGKAYFLKSEDLAVQKLPAIVKTNSSTELVNPLESLSAILSEY